MEPNNLPATAGKDSSTQPHKDAAKKVVRAANKIRKTGSWNWIPHPKDWPDNLIKAKKVANNIERGDNSSAGHQKG